MRKFLSTLLILILTLSCILALSACGKKKEKNPADSTIPNDDNIQNSDSPDIEAPKDDNDGNSDSTNGSTDKDNEEDKKPDEGTNTPDNGTENPGNDTEDPGDNNENPDEEDKPETCEHVPGDWISEKDPTCGEDGLRIKKCTVCEEKIQEEILFATGEHISGDWETALEPTNTTDGVRNKLCTVCKNVLESEVLLALGSEGIEYTYVNGGRAYYVSGRGTCKDANIVIAPTYNSRPVIGIKKEAFKNDKTLTSLTLRDGMEFIGESAFHGCSNLQKITLADTITTIESQAFYNCSKLSSISLPSQLATIGNKAFSNCSLIQQVNIPASVTSIGAGAFGSCKNVSSITVDEQNTAYYSQNNCLIETASNALIVGCKSSVIPDGVQTIKQFAFYFCTGFTRVNIPASVTLIENDVFKGCNNIESIEVAQDNPVYYSEGNCLIKRDTMSVIFGCQNSIIPNNIKEIAADAFYYTHNLKSIRIPDSVETIGSRAFSQCLNLKIVIIGNGVTTISENAFESCTGLEEIVIPNGVTNIPNQVFLSCSKIKSVYYIGTPNDWKNITVGTHNQYLTDAHIYYYSENGPSEFTHDYWCYVDGKPMSWEEILLG